MKAPLLSSSSRRDFLANVGKSMMIATVGSSLATELGLAEAFVDDAPERIRFGDLEPLVGLMQDTPADHLLSKLHQQLRNGVGLRQLIAAGALANARTFGGEDYVGFHTMMALSPALAMAGELSGSSQALPVFKVLYRNTNRIQERGRDKEDVLHAIPPKVLSATSEIKNLVANNAAFREAVHHKDITSAESIFNGLVRTSPDAAFNQLLELVQENTEVHRVVLPYRAWDLLGVTGPEHAFTLLRQSVRYCVQAESWRSNRWDESSNILAKLFEQHHLLDRQVGNRVAEDSWVESLSITFFTSSAIEAASSAAAALAEGISPDSVGEAISLAANQLVLRDHGRRPQEEQPGKPPGSVHGDSIGVHASDSTNAWRNMAQVSSPRNNFACLILGAYQVALDRTNRGGDFKTWSPLPFQNHLNEIKTTDAETLLGDAESAIQGNLQAHAAAIISRYGELGYEPRPAFQLMLRYAVSQDGALHAEKYYNTAKEEFSRTRPAFRWRQMAALARVTASEFGHPAPGMEQELANF